MARRRAAAPYCSSSFSNWAVCWTGRFAWGEGEIEQRFALGNGLLRTAARRGVECLALDLEHRFLMSGIEHEVVAIIGTYMAGDLDKTIENTHAGIGCHQGQLAPNGLRRDGVIVKV